MQIGVLAPSAVDGDGLSPLTDEDRARVADVSCLASLVAVLLGFTMRCKGSIACGNTFPAAVARYVLDRDNAGPNPLALFGTKSHEVPTTMLVLVGDLLEPNDLAAFLEVEGDHGSGSLSLPVVASRTRVAQLLAVRDAAVFYGLNQTVGQRTVDQDHLHSTAGFLCLVQYYMSNCLVCRSLVDNTIRDLRLLLEVSECVPW